MPSPPVKFIAYVQGVASSSAMTFSAIPSNVMIGDRMIILIASDNAAGPYGDSNTPAFTLRSTSFQAGAGGGRLQMYDRDYQGESSFGFYNGGAPLTHGVCVALFYRDAPDLWASVANVQYPSGTTYASSVLNLVDYYARYLAANYVSNAAGSAVTNPANTTEIAEISDGTGTLEIWDVDVEGVRGGTTSWGNTTCAAARLCQSIYMAFSGYPAMTAKPLELARPGAIGLPTEGV